MLQLFWKNLSVITRIIFKPANYLPCKPIDWFLYDLIFCWALSISEKTLTVQLANSVVKREPTEFGYIFIFDDFFLFSGNSSYRNEAFY